MKKPTTPTGNFGEDLAVAFLKKNNYKILKRNYKLPLGEIDILARQNDTIVIVEVKTKTSSLFGHPAEMVDYFKQKKLLQIAKYLEKLYSNNQLRIDIIAVDLSVEPPNIEHYINAVTE